jgi:AraC family transcriptional regulator
MKPLPQSEEYIARIHRVQDFIERNIGETLSLEVLAKVACFSPFHFHRIYSAMTGETLGQFIARVRLEKAAVKLTANPKVSITAISLECGFSGSAVFARSFNEAFGMSATEWRNGGNEKFSKNRKTESNPGKTIGKQRKASESSLSYLDEVHTGKGALPAQHSSKTRRDSMKNASTVKADVSVENLPEMTVAYIRHVGPYQGNGQLFGMLWGKLMKWAGPRGLMAQPDVKMLCVYHDDPEVTDEMKLRVSVCVTVPSETRVDGEVGLMNIASGAYATARFEISEHEFQSAWDYMFGVWLPQSGYQPDDRLCFEWCMNDPQKHPEHKHIVKICIPVKPL